MPVTAMAVLPAAAASSQPVKKGALAPEKKYKCQFCNRAFSRSEHRSRHERSRKFLPYVLSLKAVECRTRLLCFPQIFFLANLVVPDTVWGRGSPEHVN